MLGLIFLLLLYLYMCSNACKLPKDLILSCLILYSATSAVQDPSVRLLCHRQKFRVSQLSVLFQLS